MSGKRAKPNEPPLSEEAILDLQRRRFQARVNRVLEVMKRERVDWRGVAGITEDGRIGTRVVPVDMTESA